jgi:hypothetical protein
MTENRPRSLSAAAKYMTARVLLVQSVHGLPLILMILFSKYASCALQERWQVLADVVDTVYSITDFPASEFATNATTHWETYLNYQLALGSLEWLIITFFAGLMSMSCGGKWAWLAWMLGLYLFVCGASYAIFLLILSGM